MAQGISFARKFGALSFALVASAALADDDHGSHRDWPVIDYTGPVDHVFGGGGIEDRKQATKPKVELGAKQSEKLLETLQDANVEEQKLNLSQAVAYELSRVLCYQTTFPPTEAYARIPRGPMCSARDTVTGKEIRFDAQASQVIHAALPGRGFEPGLADTLRWSAERITCTKTNAAESPVVSCIVQSRIGPKNPVRAR